MTTQMQDDTLREAIIQDWKDHTKQPEAVMDRLQQRVSTPMGDTALIELGALATHLFGEHLGSWDSGQQYLNRLKEYHPDASREALFHIDRQSTILARSQGHEISDSNGESYDRFYTTVLAIPAVTLRRSAVEGGELLHQACGQLATLNDLKAHKLLAVVTANLTCDLLEKQALTETEKGLLLELAEHSKALWMEVGSATDHERASFRLSQAQLACQRPTGYGSGRYPRYLWIEA